MKLVEVEPGCPNCGTGFAYLRGGNLQIEFTCNACLHTWNAKPYPPGDSLGSCDVCGHAAATVERDGVACCTACAVTLCDHPETVTFDDYGTSDTFCTECRAEVAGV